MTKRERYYYDPGAGGKTAFWETPQALNAIIENSYDGIYLTDGNAVTVRMNRSYEIISGLRRENMLGRNMRELVAEGVISQSGTLLALERGESVTLEQVFETGKAAVITSTPVYDGEGHVAMVVTNVRDVTELNGLKEELAEREEAARRADFALEVIRRQALGEDDVIAADRNMQDVLLMARKVAVLDTTVLLLGETGVGKEKLAGYICRNSRRKDRPFVKVNCGAIPPTLIESELFGYEKGAFTGADRNGKPGLFEAADGGTIFLDEVAELPPQIQVKFLRVLQEQEVERIGAITPRKIDVRVLAATNRNLEEMVHVKRFRDDLYYRLDVFPITIPPLRCRRDDIIPYMDAFLAELNSKYELHKRVSPAAYRAALAYRWPGNVRELRNLVERAIVLSTGDLITAEDMSIRPCPGAATPAGVAGENPVDLRAVVEQLELDYMTGAYARYGNVRDAAGSLGMDPSTFVRKRKRYEKLLQNRN